MQAADCFVLSSLRETFGVVLIEALASGTPIISTRCGGTDDVVTETNGLLVDTADDTALGNAMVYMFEHKDQYQPMVLREECRARFGKDPFLKRISHFYNTALGLA